MKRNRLHYRVARKLGYELVPERKNHLRLEAHLGKLFSRYGVNGLIDVGANTGQFARRMRAIGFSGPIFSFEPEPSAYRELARAAQDDADWHVFDVALGAAPGRESLHVAAETEFSSFCALNRYGREHFRVEADAEVEVEVRRLGEMGDQLTAGLDAPRLFLKMDTQGWDLEVFAGAGALLDGVVGLQSELALKPIYDGMPDLVDGLAAYRAAGFEVSGAYPVNRDPDTLAVIEMDCILVRSDRVLR